MFFPRYSQIPVRSRNEVVFWCFAVFMLLLFLGRNALWGLEGRCAEVVREMLVTGDIFNPQINAVAEKTRLPLSYWVLLPGTILFGTDEFILRLPAVISALILLAATRMITRKLFDAETALISMWVLLSTYGFVFWSRVAAPDIANAAAVACAVACFLHWNDIPHFKDYLLFYLLLGAGSLFKGVPMVAIVFLLVLPFVFKKGNLKKYCSWQHFFALLLGICAGMIPYWLFGAFDAGLNGGGSAAGSGIEILWKTQILRILDARFSGEKAYSYLYHLPRILIPWSAVFAVGFFTFVKKHKSLPGEFSSLLSGIFLVFLLFSLFGSRRWYYLLPLVPFCSVVTAAVLNGYAGESKTIDWILELTYFGLLAFASLALALPIALPLQGIVFRYYVPMIVILSCFCAGFIIVLLLIFDRGEDNSVARFFAMPPRIAGLTAGMAIAVTTIFCSVLPAFTVFRSERPFALELRKQVDGISPDKIFFCSGALNSRVLFYLAPIQPVKHGENLAAFICRNAGGRIAVISEDTPAALSSLEKELDKLQSAVLKTDKPHIQETHLYYEPKGKEKLRAWIFDVPANMTIKQQIDNKKGPKNE